MARRAHVLKTCCCRKSQNKSGYVIPSHFFVRFRCDLYHIRSTWFIFSLAACKKIYRNCIGFGPRRSLSLSLQPHLFVVAVVPWCVKALQFTFCNKSINCQIFCKLGHPAHVCSSVLAVLICFLFQHFNCNITFCYFTRVLMC